MIGVCPCCQQPLPDDLRWSPESGWLVANGKAVRIFSERHNGSSQRGVLLDMLIDAHHSRDTITPRDVLNRWYRDDPDGGPDWAESGLSVALTDLRKLLAKVDCTVASGGKVGGKNAVQFFLAPAGTHGKGTGSKRKLLEAYLNA